MWHLHKISELFSSQEEQINGGMHVLLVVFGTDFLLLMRISFDSQYVRVTNSTEMNLILKDTWIHK